MEELRIAIIVLSVMSFIAFSIITIYNLLALLFDADYRYERGKTSPPPAAQKDYNNSLT